MIFIDPSCPSNRATAVTNRSVMLRFLARELVGCMIGRKIPLLNANLAYPQPPHATVLKYLLPCPQSFDQITNEITFDSQYLNLAPIRSETDLVKFLENSPADLMAIPGDDRSLKKSVTRLISAKNQDDASFPHLEQIAEQLHLTPQTLHRRLTKEGTSYQKIKDNIRRDIAVTRLVNFSFMTKSFL